MRQHLRSLASPFEVNGATPPEEFLAALVALMPKNALSDEMEWTNALGSTVTSRKDSSAQGTVWTTLGRLDESFIFYVRAWTEFDDSDPGNPTLELFAFLAETWLIEKIGVERVRLDRESSDRLFFSAEWSITLRGGEKVLVPSSDDQLTHRFMTELREDWMSSCRSRH